MIPKQHWQSQFFRATQPMLGLDKQRPRLPPSPHVSFLAGKSASCLGAQVRTRLSLETV